MKQYNLCSLLLIVVGSMMIFSCTPELNSYNSNNIEKKNITIILDLSDRIIKSNNQFKNDSAIIQNIYNVIVNRAKNIILTNNKNFDLANDKINLIVAPQVGAPEISNDLLKNFYLNFNTIAKTKKSQFKFVFNGFTTQISKSIEQLYSISTFSDNPNKYKGADIYEVLNNYKGENDYVNYIIIITDGYMYVKNTQTETDRDFPRLNSKLDNVKIAIVEINPKKKRHELETLKKSWIKWLMASSVDTNDILFEKTDISSKINDDIRLFLINDEKIQFPKSNSINPSKDEKLISDNENVYTDFEGDYLGTERGTMIKLNLKEPVKNNDKIYYKYSLFINYNKIINEGIAVVDDNNNIDFINDNHYTNKTKEMVSSILLNSKLEVNSVSKYITTKHCKLSLIN